MHNRWQQTTRILVMENVLITLIVLVVLQHFSPIKWSWGLVLSLCCGLIGLAIIEGVITWHQQYNRQKTIDRMEAKLRQMSSQQFPPHILLPQSDPLYSLAQAVNQLESFQKHQTRRAELQEKELIDPDLTVTSDAQKLNQIVKNLLTNAIKYNRPQGSVTIATHVGEQSWSLIIKDTGIGISADDQQRIFERFYRASPSRSQQLVSGTGLGLAIVQELVNAMQGTIEVVSQRGVGTTMTVTLPLIAPESD